MHSYILFANGKSEFLRPMPGAARMYPETDLPLLKISRNMINSAKKSLPKLHKDIKKELESQGLNQEMIKSLLKQDKIEEFKELLNIIKEPHLIAKVLLMFPKEIASREKISLKKVEKILDKDILSSVLENVKKRKISKSDIKHVLEKIVKGHEIGKALLVEKEDIHAVEEKIIKIIKNKPGLSSNAYMGLVMKEFKGKVSGKHAMEIIRKHLD